ncbi:hypothetical protein BH10BAC4_BH10BAC4_25800 [soil metagenome]
MKLLLSITLTCFILTSSFAQKLQDPILLWPSGAPGATGITDEDKPAIIPFIPDTPKRNGAAVLVVPGGGFATRAVDHEGILVAQWFREHGITAFVLRYRIRPLYNRVDWIRDGERAMQYIRSHAAEYQISADRVGAIGFSAGAFLISDMALNVTPAKPNAPDLLDRFSTRPDFLLLGYGATQIPTSADSLIVSKMPPTFMYGTQEDKGSTRNMIDFYARLFKAGAPVEFHIFQNGVHGSGFALGDPILGEWPTLMHTWLRAGGFFTDKKQVSLSGTAKLDGSPLLKGMVIFTPAENLNAPPVVAYINNTGTGELGRFLIPESYGPVPGKYRVEMRQDAKRWMSNSRDPFMIKMMTKQRDNTLTDQDIKDWGEFLRKRDLSPSIVNQQVFSKQRPGDKGDYVIDIKDGEEVRVEVFRR